MSSDTPVTPVQVGERFADENRQAEDLIGQGDLAGAARILVGIVEKDNGNWRTYNNMGIISWIQKEWKDAFAMFKKAVNLYPGYTDALINLFDAALKLHCISEVAPLFQRAASLEPHAEEITVIAEAIAEQGDNIYMSERGLIVGTHNPRIEEANKLLEDGQLFKAMEKYLQVNDQEGPNADAFGGLGVVSFYQERYQDAFALFVESIKLNPLNRDIYLNLIDAAKACGRAAEARSVFETYLKEFPVLQSLASEFEAKGA